MIKLRGLIVRCMSRRTVFGHEPETDQLRWEEIEHSHKMDPRSGDQKKDWVAGMSRESSFAEYNSLTKEEIGHASEDRRVGDEQGHQTEDPLYLDLGDKSCRNDDEKNTKYHRLPERMKIKVEQDVSG